MAANINPIFGLTPHVSGGSTGTTNHVETDGTTATVVAFTAGANGSRIDDIYLTHLGANTATVVRFFVNNGSAVGTAANNFLYHEETMATLASLSQVAASSAIKFNANLILPAGYRIYVTIGTAIASGIMVMCVGSDF